MSEFILVPADTRYFTGEQTGQQIYGKPLITKEMKAECIGEFWVEFDGRKTMVDWPTIKEIYTRMVQAAAKEAL